MKNKILLFFVITISMYSSAQVGIGTSNPDASAALEIQSTSRGLLIPKLSKIQRDAINSPAVGLLLYQTDNNPGFYYYNASNTWIRIGSNNTSNIAANTASITANINDIALKAPLASPTFTGTPSLPTGTTGITQSPANNSTAIATTAYVDNAASTASRPLTDGNIFLGNSSNVATGVAISGDVTMDNTGVTTIGPSKVVNAMINNDAVTTAKIADGSITDAKIASAINATKLADGSVTNTELQYIGTLTSNAQTQIDAVNTTGSNNTSNIAANTASITANINDIALKAPLASPTFSGTVTVPTLVAGTNTFPTVTGSANQVLTTNGSGTLAWTTPSTTSAGTKQGQILIWNGSSWVPTGDSKLSIGENAGLLSQGTKSIAIGYQAGYNTQKSYSIALGSQAGKITQGQSAVAIGKDAGITNQGNYSIAIGNSAGYLNQPANNIVINALSSALNPATTGFFVKPIRSTSANSNILTYEPTTGEISYATTTNTASITTNTSSITANINDLALKAPLASPTFTGTPSLPTGTTGITQSPANNSTAIATTAYVDNAASTASTTGNAATATKFAATVNINGEAFDGSADITVTADAGTLSGSTLNSTVTGSSLTSVGTLSNLTVNGKIIAGAANFSTTSAVLEASSTTQGFLPPRLDQNQRNSISSAVAGLIIWCSNCGTAGELQVYNGSIWTNLTGGDAAAKVARVAQDIISATGKTWLDQNLGAYRVAESSTDFEAYGDLYQWGRGSDGHQTMVWTDPTNGSGTPTTGTRSSSDSPGNSFFITAGDNDWRTTPNNNLWQGAYAANNPCPTGYRIPTKAEWEEEKNSWSSANSSGAFASALKLPTAGNRLGSGALSAVGTWGIYASSTIGTSYPSTQFQRFIFSTDLAVMNDWYKANGVSVRCIKN